MQTVECDLLILGAGVIGLSVAAKSVGVLGASASVIAIEQFPRFGQETSSRNSEVVHSGIYYPADSLKTKFCLEGRPRLYEFCEKNAVPFARTGKYVVATTEGEMAYLENLAAHCASLGVPYSRVSGEAVRRAEPLVDCREALFFPETGIVDSHELMKKLGGIFVAGGGLLAYGHRLAAAEKTAQGWKIMTRVGEESVEILAARVVNATGLAAAQVSNQALRTDRYAHRFCRGRYLNLSARYRGKFSRLIYPVPPKDGLGVHVTVDTHGFARLGPDVDWCPPATRYEELAPYYDCDWDGLAAPFLRAVNRYFPSARAEDLGPGQIGIRAKLFVDGEKHPDFLLENQHGWIHALGIESPGLTSSLAIAEAVGRELRRT